MTKLRPTFLPSEIFEVGRCAIFLRSRFLPIRAAGKPPNVSICFCHFYGKLKQKLDLKDCNNKKVDRTEGCRHCLRCYRLIACRLQPSPPRQGKINFFYFVKIFCARGANLISSPEFRMILCLPIRQIVIKQAYLLEKLHAKFLLTKNFWQITNKLFSAHKHRKTRKNEFCYDFAIFEAHFSHFPKFLRVPSLIFSVHPHPTLGQDRREK